MKIPRRLISLTNFTNKKLKKAIPFNIFLNKLNRLIKKNSFLIANGEDVKLLKMNIDFNRLKSLNKNVNCINLRNITKEETGKKLETEKLKKYFKININLKSHNSLDDCKIVFYAIKNIKKQKSFIKFSNLIKKNLEKTKL